MSCLTASEIWQFEPCQRPQPNRSSLLVYTDVLNRGGRGSVVRLIGYRAAEIAANLCRPLKRLT
jgi:hypothetical protein